jgi:ATP-dependent Clp protease, protease subunit
MSSVNPDGSISSPLSINEVMHGAQSRPKFPMERMIEYFGCVNYATNDRVLQGIKALLKKSPTEPMYLVVTCAGGPSGSAMGFYDTIRTLLKPKLVTVGAGDVDSSGLIIFLAGDKRFVTVHTTALLHRAGRVFNNDKRVTAEEMRAMLREDTLKDDQYASIVADRSRGKLTKLDVLRMMDRSTTLTPQDFVTLGLADAILA